ncbi:MAG TPA: hypothetical protein VMW65_16435, partial [Chloroflexota bacterium]|nr:hypothetical protein [Chloroflexota bacterium]
FGYSAIDTSLGRDDAVCRRHIVSCAPTCPSAGPLLYRGRTTVYSPVQFAQDPRPTQKDRPPLLGAALLGWL